MTSNSNELAGTSVSNSGEKEGIQNQGYSHAPYVEFIHRRGRPKNAGKPSRDYSMEYIQQEQKAAKGISDPSNAGVLSESLIPYRELLCAMVEQAFEDAKNEKVYQRNNTANLRDANFASAIYFFKTKFFQQPVPTLEGHCRDKEQHTHI